MNLDVKRVERVGNVDNQVKSSLLHHIQNEKVRVRFSFFNGNDWRICGSASASHCANDAPHGKVPLGTGCGSHFVSCRDQISRMFNEL